MAKTRITAEQRAVRELRVTEAKLEADLAGISAYAGDYWRDYRGECQQALSRVQATIRNVEANGLPEGWTEKWSK